MCLMTKFSFEDLRYVVSFSSWDFYFSGVLISSKMVFMISLMTEANNFRHFLDFSLRSRFENFKKILYLIFPFQDSLQNDIELNAQKIIRCIKKENFGNFAKIE